MILSGLSSRRKYRRKKRRGTSYLIIVHRSVIITPRVKREERKEKRKKKATAFPFLPLPTYVLKIRLSKFRSSNSRNETTRNNSEPLLRISRTGEQIRGTVPGTEIVHLRGDIVTRGVGQGENLFTKLSIVIERGTTGPRGRLNSSGGESL